jgi:hypothetical protein
MKRLAAAYCLVKAGGEQQKAQRKGQGFDTCPREK